MPHVPAIENPVKDIRTLSEGVVKPLTGAADMPPVQQNTNLQWNRRGIVTRNSLTICDKVTEQVCSSNDD